MKRFSAVALAVFFTLTIGISRMVAAPQSENASSQAQSSPASASQTANSEEPRKAVLVELFTSEGCSSCPPADKLLQQMATLQPIPGVEIVPLEEHVDYWNHDGWVDPFSSADLTERQHIYASLIKKDEYTPELVVDGRSQFLGSNGPEAESAIEKASRDEKTNVTITPDKAGGKNSPRFSISVAKLNADTSHDAAEVWIAVTEDGLHSSVSAGENKGREMNHVATLRTLRKIGVADPGKDVSFSGDTDVKLNSHWNVSNLHVTVFVQKKKSREILGVATTKVS
jgi:hypothetical protein